MQRYVRTYTVQHSTYVKVYKSFFFPFFFFFGEHKSFSIYRIYLQVLFFYCHYSESSSNLLTITAIVLVLYIIVIITG